MPLDEIQLYFVGIPKNSLPSTFIYESIFMQLDCVSDSCLSDFIAMKYSPLDLEIERKCKPPIPRQGLFFKVPWLPDKP